MSFYVHEFSAADEEAAASAASQMLRLVRSLNLLGPEHHDFVHGSTALVGLEGTGEYRAISMAPAPLERRGRRAPEPKPKTLARIASQIFSEFSQASSPRLFASIQTAIQAASGSSEARMLALWSTIEVLFGDPPVGTARIVHYARSMTPCVCLRYARRLIAATHEIVQHSRGRAFNRIIAAEKESGVADQHTRLASILMHPNNQPLRDRLLAISSDSPLMLQCWHKLHSNFSSPKSFRSMVEGHQRRIEWQIYRIYRARNQLAHAGAPYPNLDALVSNTLEYYKTSIWTLVARVKKEDDRSSLSTAVREVGTEYDIYLDFLRDASRSDQFDQQSICAAMHA